MQYGASGYVRVWPGARDVGERDRLHHRFFVYSTYLPPADTPLVLVTETRAHIEAHLCLIPAIQRVWQRRARCADPAQGMQNLSSMATLGGVSALSSAFWLHMK